VPDPRHALCGRADPDRAEFRRAHRPLGRPIELHPLCGSLTGLFLSVGVSLVQFWPDWTLIAATLGIFAGGQFIEGNILSPKLVGTAVGLHPVWLMFALFAFGSLFGFVGLLLAVPLAAAAGVLARFALERYMESPLYRGDLPPVPRAETDA
jgi:predicted PurR-regulated permease PerM